MLWCMPWCMPAAWDRHDDLQRPIQLNAYLITGRHMLEWLRAYRRWRSSLKGWHRMSRLCAVGAAL